MPQIHNPKAYRTRWEKDPSAIYRVMGMQQAFTPAEQATLNLPVREALQSLRAGTADENHWNTLAGVANVCLLRGERIAQQVVDVAKDAQAAVLDILERHKRTAYVTKEEMAQCESENAKCQ